MPLPPNLNSNPRPFNSNPNPDPRSLNPNTLEHPYLLPPVTLTPQPRVPTHLGHSDGGSDVEAILQVGPESLGGD